MESNLIRQYLESLIRSLLTPLAMWLSANGYLPENQVIQLVAILVSLVVTIGWSWGNKYFWQRKVEVALQLPAGSSVKTLNQIVRK